MSEQTTKRQQRQRRDATGQLVESKRARGSSTGLRFKHPGQRVYETLGRSCEGCDRREAQERAQRLMAQVRLGQYRSKAQREAERAEREAQRTEVPTFEAFAAEWLDRRLVLGGRRGEGLSASGETDLRWRLRTSRIAQRDEQQAPSGSSTRSCSRLKPSAAAPGADRV